MTDRGVCSCIVRLLRLSLTLIFLILLEDRFGTLSANAQISTLSITYTTSSSISFYYPMGWEVNELIDLTIMHPAVEGTEGLVEFIDRGTSTQRLLYE